MTKIEKLVTATTYMSGVVMGYALAMVVRYFA